MKKVLVVDDEKIFLESVCDGFKPLSGQIKILTAIDGLEALEVLQKEKVDLLVTDLKMPRMDGFELISHVCKNFPDLPIIVITAFGTQETERKLEKFVVDYIEKPIDFNKFVEKVTATVNEAAFGKIHGITLFGFLQLIEIEKKTCTLVIKESEKVGTMHFLSGKFLDAEFENLRGEEAAYKILSWENPEIEVCKINVGKNSLTSTVAVTELLLEAAKRLDEANFQNGFSSEDEVDKVLEKKLSPGSVNLIEEIDENRKIGQIAEALDRVLAKISSLEEVASVGFFDQVDKQFFAYRSGKNSRNESLARWAVELLFRFQQIFNQLQEDQKIKEMIIDLGKKACLLYWAPKIDARVGIAVILEEKASLPLVRLEIQRLLFNF